MSPETPENMNFQDKIDLTIPKHGDNEQEIYITLKAGVSKFPELSQCGIDVSHLMTHKQDLQTMKKSDETDIDLVIEEIADSEPKYSNQKTRLNKINPIFYTQTLFTLPGPFFGNEKMVTETRRQKKNKNKQ